MLSFLKKLSRTRSGAPQDSPPAHARQNTPETDNIPLFTTTCPSELSLNIAYQAPKRQISRILLRGTGTTDPGYDCVQTIASDHIGTYGLRDIGIHIYINSRGDIEWGRSLERPAEFPREAASEDIVILVHGHEISMSIATLNTLRALLPIINAIHGNTLAFDGLIKHHARLGIGRDGRMIEVALQQPPTESS